jgi:hypothetical protein
MLQEITVHLAQRSGAQVAVVVEATSEREGSLNVIAMLSELHRERQRILSEIRFLEHFARAVGRTCHLIANHGARHRPATKSMILEIRKSMAAPRNE